MYACIDPACLYIYIYKCLYKHINVYTTRRIDTYIHKRLYKYVRCRTSMCICPHAGSIDTYMWNINMCNRRRIHTYIHVYINMGTVAHPSCLHAESIHTYINVRMNTYINVRMNTCTVAHTRTNTRTLHPRGWYTPGVDSEHLLDNIYIYI